MIANYLLPLVSRDFSLIFVGLTGVNHTLRYLLGPRESIYLGTSENMFLLGDVPKQSSLDIVTSDSWLHSCSANPVYMHTADFQVVNVTRTVSTLRNNKYSETLDSADLLRSAPGNTTLEQLIQLFKAFAVPK